MESADQMTGPQKSYRVLGSVLQCSTYALIYFLQQPREGGTRIIPALQMLKLVTWLAVVRIRLFKVCLDHCVRLPPVVNSVSWKS